MKQLFERQHHLDNKVVKLEKDMISLTVSSNAGETSTSTTAVKPAEYNNPHAEWKKTTSVIKEDYNTSGGMVKKRVEQDLPNQALTVFAPVSMAEDLAKIQLILCK